MEKIYNNLNIENLIKTDWFNQFSESQQEEIRLGIENNVDISFYAKSDFSDYQMDEIKLGLKDNLDVFLYTKPEISSKQMMEIRRKLLKKREKLENE